MLEIRDIENYIDNVFKHAFESEGRVYRKHNYIFDFVLIKNSNNEYQLYPNIWCRYGRVLQKVNNALENNLYKNTGVHYLDTDVLRCDLHRDTIDCNFTQAAFNNKVGERLYLDVYDDYEDRAIKLIMKCYGITRKEYDSLDCSDCRRSLPYTTCTIWNHFVNLYNRTFSTPIGSYDIICSTNLTRL